MKDFNIYLTKLYQFSLILFVMTGLVVAWTEIPVFAGMEKTKAIYIASLMSFLFYADRMAGLHAKWIKRNATINHGLFAIARVLASIGIFFLFNYTDHFGYVKGIFLSASLLFTFSFWFDIKLNSLRGLPFDYTGEASLYDRALGKENWKIDLVIIVIGLLVL